MDNLQLLRLRTYPEKVWLDNSKTKNKYLECLNNKPLIERFLDYDVRYGLILYEVFQDCTDQKERIAIFVKSLGLKSLNQYKYKYVTFNEKTYFKVPLFREFLLTENIEFEEKLARGKLRFELFLEE